MHPDDARALLREWRQSMDASREQVKAQRDDLPAIVAGAEKAGLTKTEIAELVGMSRQSLYQYMTK